MEKEVVEVPVVSEMIRKVGVPLSPVVRANGFVFVSGLPGIDLATSKVVDGGIEEQAEASLAAVKHALEAAGSSLEKVVKATVYVSNAAHFSKANRVYARYFPEKPPARTFVAVGSWPMEFDIEIECVALA
jgi:2-iminobutanoate/2-iminopropanoate deaminase